MNQTINDTFFTISKKSEAEFKDKGSKFIGIAFPFENIDELKPILSEIKSQHPKARHFCFAYKLGLDNDNSRSNDDGEPSGSAGKPILNAILSKNLSNILIVVVRYFGGTLLGVPGLINAYKSAALGAIENNEIETKFVKSIVQINFEFEKTNEIMRIVKEFDLKILKQDYLENCIWDIEIRESLVEKVLSKVMSYKR
jgi:uncharacterized YigZ family protein